MFRLVFLTFHGEPRGEAAAGHLHDAPVPMAVALIALAIGSALAGYLGIPAVLGGSDWFARFLAPSFAAAGAAAPDAGASSLQGGLMAVSTLAALGGIGVAAVLFLRDPAAADRLAERFGGLHHALERKLYVDDVYDAGIVQPIRIVSEEGLWHGVDERLIDGAVNGVGAAVKMGAGLLRRLQTGSVRVYAASMLVGVVLILGYYFW